MENLAQGLSKSIERKWKKRGAHSSERTEKQKQLMAKPNPRWQLGLLSPGCHCWLFRTLSHFPRVYTPSEHQTILFKIHMKRHNQNYRLIRQGGLKNHLPSSQNVQMGQIKHRISNQGRSRARVRTQIFLSFSKHTLNASCETLFQHQGYLGD